MDELAELREWQRLQEEVVRSRQTQQMDSFTQQNTKVNALTSDDKQTNGSTDESESNQWYETRDTLNIATNKNDSINEMSAEEVCNEKSVEEVCDQKSDKQNSSNNSYLESCPVVPGVNGKEVKTFEQLLAIKLNDKNSEFAANNSTKPKKPFLRKGEGIKRFEGNKSQTNQSTKESQKRVCFNTRPNETTGTSDKSRPKIQYSVKQFVNKRKLNKIEENETKPKPFIRKVIPMTTKFGKVDNKSVEITRNTPTVLLNGLNETESELFDYLRQIYENVSIDDSFDKKFKNKDINELQDLLEKIEMKRETIEGQLDTNPLEDKVTKKSRNLKKRVHFNQTQTQSDEESDENIIDLIEPKAGAYSSKLKQQIYELEDQLSGLKNMKKDKSIDKSMAKTSENIEPINGELIKLKEQIDKLSKRIVNIESKAYDMNLKPKCSSICNKKYFNGRTSPKVISPPTARNVLVNESSNDTTIDFPNGDKMMVSKDNTILYTFANGTTQTTYPDGFKITHFPNGQTEKVDRNGVKRITYSNGLQRTINADSSEEVLMTDGTLWRIYSDGSEVLEFPDGDREIRTNKYKRREYRNGNIKTVYSDGTEESRYINGRLRIKDKFGNLMVDSMAKHLDQHF